MKILALADFHAEEIILSRLKEHLKSEEYDAITISGDLTENGPVSYVQELLKILKGQKVFAVLGNCDPKQIKENLGGACVENRNVEFKGLNITGIGGGVISRHGTINEKSEEEFEKELKGLKIDEKTIFISHCPPYGILDTTFNGEKIGSKSIKKMIEERKPKLFVCGHVHEEEGWEKVNKTIVINLPPAKRLRAGVIEINEKIDVKFIDI